MVVLILGLFTFLIVALIPSLCILWMVNWGIKKKGWSKHLRLLALIPLFVFGYFVYDAIYPAEDFYRQEFETGTGIDFPSEGKILFKTASFPDHFGDYSSVFCFETDSAFYDKLLSELELIGDTTPIKHIDFIEMSERVEGKQLETQISYDRGTVIYYVGFFSDKKTILFHRVSY